MKPLILTLLACATSALAQMPLVHLPIDTNSLVGTSTPFWLSNPPPAYVAAYQVYQAVEENNKRIEAAFGALSDTQTNAVTNTRKLTAFTLNSLTVPHGGWVTLGVVTNFAGLDWTVLQGSPLLYFSTDGGSNWLPCTTSLITNRTVWLKATTVTNVPGLDVPIAAVMTNITFYTLEQPWKFGTVVGLYSQSVRGDDPERDDEYATKRYVDRAAAQGRSWTAPEDLHMNGHAVNLDPEWQIVANRVGSNHVAHFRFLGEDKMTMIEAPPTPIGGAWIAVSGTNCTVSVATNGLANPPRLQVTHYLSPMSWSWVDTIPTVSGTNYQFVFGLPWTDSGFFMSFVPSRIPSQVCFPGSVTAANGFYLFSPNGTRYRLQVSNSGVLAVVQE